MITRIISGLTLGILFLLLTMQSEPYVLVAFGIPLVIAQIEFTSLFPGVSKTARALWVVSAVVFGGLIYAWMNPVWGFGSILAVAALAVMMDSTSTAEVIRYEREGGDGGRVRGAPVFFSLFAISMGFALLAMIAVLSDGFPYLLLLIGASWVADTAGVFCGKYFGKNKLVPNLSPKKTREGAVGGILAGGLCWMGTVLVFDTSALSSFYTGINPALLPWLMFGMGALVSAVGITGDLAFSMHKRKSGIKDYSSIIPGHGGVLDRFDAMLYAAPLLVLGFLG